MQASFSPIWQEPRTSSNLRLRLSHCTRAQSDQSKLAHVIVLVRVESLIQEVPREDALPKRIARGPVKIDGYTARTSFTGLNRVRMDVDCGLTGCIWLGRHTSSADQQVRINAGVSMPRMSPWGRDSWGYCEGQCQRWRCTHGNHPTAQSLGHRSKLTQACQLAKSGIVNSRLLYHGEAQAILAEVKNFPYQNVRNAHFKTLTSIPLSRSITRLNECAVTYPLPMAVVVDFSLVECLCL